ncbi:hypothetical protein O6H91_07G060700 [Diphasiastrum complanatum]|nr:hypothetical protein O6H91_07G060700 [Diphasiastrum complanatum]
MVDSTKSNDKESPEPGKNTAQFGAATELIDEDSFKDGRKIAAQFVDGSISSDEGEGEGDDTEIIIRMGRTENDSATYLSSGNECLNFFFHVVPDTPSSRVVELLEKAWLEDALIALRLVFQLRGVRGKGKTDKANFYTAALWLHENHPATLVANIAKVAAFGYYKDLPEIVLRILEGPEGFALRQHRKSLFEKAKKSKKRTSGRLARTHDSSPDSDEEEDHAKPVRGSLKKKICKAIDLCRREGCSMCQELTDDLKEVALEGADKPRSGPEAASALRESKRIAEARKAVKMFYFDYCYRNLYNAVAKTFADQLKKDMAAVKEGNTRDISLAAKWCPSLDASYDRKTLLCESIARKFFTKREYPEYVNMEDRVYAYRIRDRLRKEVLVILHRAIQMPEIPMSAKEWGAVNYKRVPSVAMKNYKKLFLTHDEPRFRNHLEDVTQGRAKIAAGAVLPHEIVKEALVEDGDAAVVAELQWNRMVDDLKKKGKLSDSIAVCDVSGSMDGTPMEVCIALGLLVSEISEEPWKGRVITFSSKPQLHVVQGSTLAEKYQFTATMDWGANTNLQAVFDRILDLAQATALPPERMIKRLFIFSDMEFDQASKNPWETDYIVICSKFEAAGYGSPPQVVFWNLRNSISNPVIAEQDGVALVSGFSKNLLKCFLENDGVINPKDIMMDAISHKLYQELVVVD